MPTMSYRSKASRIAATASFGCTLPGWEVDRRELETQRTISTHASGR
jgi:hypothetical protein